MGMYDLGFMLDMGYALSRYQSTVRGVRSTRREASLNRMCSVHTAYYQRLMYSGISLTAHHSYLPLLSYHLFTLVC